MIIIINTIELYCNTYLILVWNDKLARIKLVRIRDLGSKRGEL